MTKKKKTTALRQPVKAIKAKTGAQKPVVKAKKAKPKPKKPKAKKPKVKVPRGKTLAQHQTGYGVAMKKGGVVEANRLMDLDSNERLCVSTGSLELDRVLTPTMAKVGGIPIGRLTEIWGTAHIGKTTLLDHIFTSVQRMKGVGILVETDTKRDPQYTQAIGVDTSKLEYIEFNQWDERHMESAMDAMIKSVIYWRTEAPEIPVIVGIDALGVTPTKEEVGKDLAAKGTTASAARILRRACRKLAPAISGTNCGIVILNHEYARLGFGGGPTGKAVYGGQAMELLATVRLKLHSVEKGWLQDSNGVTVGRVVGYDLKKFKLGPAFRQGKFAILSGVGIDNTWTVFDRLTKRQLIATSGSWSAVNIDGEVIKFQGYMGLRNKCLEHPELFTKLVEVYRGIL